VAGYSVHGAYDRLLAGVAGGLVRMVEPAGQDTRLTAIPGGIRVDPPYPSVEPFVVRTLEMHFSTPLALALLLVGGRRRIPWSRRLLRLLAGGGFLMLAHLAALVAQLEFSPLVESGVRWPGYHVYRFAWWVLTVWSLLLLPAVAALAIYLADWRGQPTSRGPRARRPLLWGMGAAAAFVILLSVTLAHLRPEPGGAQVAPQRGHRGLQAFQEGRYQEAVLAFRSQLEREPENITLRFNLGVSLYRMARFDEALQELNLVRNRRPDYPGLDLALGAVLHDLGREEGALEAFGRVDLARQSDPDLLARVGAVLEAGGDAAGAERVYRRALEVRPAHAITLHRLGNLLLGQERGNEAIDLFRLAARARPDDAAALSYLGAALQQSGRFREAAEAYHRALALAPGDLAALFNLGVIRMQEQDPCPARDYFTRCIETPGLDAYRRRCQDMLDELTGRCGG
jgi:Flp pilus assembly protein TadD